MIRRRLYEAGAFIRGGADIYIGERVGVLFGWGNLRVGSEGLIVNEIRIYLGLIFVFHQNRHIRI